MLPSVQIGITLKTVGYKGNVRIKIDPEFSGSLDKIDLFLLKVEGDMVPYWIEDLEETGSSFIIKFEGINSPEQAHRIVNRSVYMLERDVLKHYSKIPTPKKHPLVGYFLMDQYDNNLGFIKSVEQYPQQEMAVVEISGVDHLIPVHESLILELDTEQKTIHLSLPEGLLDLN